MKIILCGGSGQVGGVLQRAFAGGGNDVVVLSRSATYTPADGARCVPWHPDSSSGWAKEFDGADVVINLAGRSVNCRYHERNRRAIMDSRIQSTRAVGQAIAQAKRPPAVWLQMSTATIYAHRFDAANDEASGILGGGADERGAPDTWKFSIGVAQAWERSCREVDTPHTRKVLLRSAMVMSPDAGGVFEMLSRLVSFGLGGRQGSGRQYVSWIHETDFVRAVKWLIKHTQMEGPVNLAAPNPLPNRDFMQALRQAWGARLGLPATPWTLEVGAFLLRTESELILKSRRVVPGRLLEAGFEFQFPDWPKAASELVARRREWKRVTPEDLTSTTKSAFAHGPT